MEGDACVPSIFDWVDDIQHYQNKPQRAQLLNFSACNCTMTHVFLNLIFVTSNSPEKSVSDGSSDKTNSMMKIILTWHEIVCSLWRKLTLFDPTETLILLIGADFSNPGKLIGCCSSSVVSLTLSHVTEPLTHQLPDYFSTLYSLYCGAQTGKQ